MRMLWRHFLALSLGMLATGAYAQQGGWKSSETTRNELPAPGTPIAVSRPEAPRSAGSTPASAVPAQAQPAAAALGRPIAIASSRPDQPWQPPTQTPTAPVVRGSSPDMVDAIPSGPVNPTVVYPGLHSWRRADEGISLVSRTVPVGNSVLPSPTLNGPALNGPSPMPTGTPMPGGPAPSPINAPMGPGYAPQQTYGPMMTPPVATPVPSLYATAPGQPCGPPAACGPECLANCGCGCGCPPGNLWFFGAEYLLWSVKSDVTPPLVTGGNPLVNPNAGTLGPGTAVLYGGTGLGDQLRSGLRLSAGMWFSDAHCWGIEANAWWLSRLTNNFSAGSNGFPSIGRPIVYEGPPLPLPNGGVLVPGTEAQEFVASPLALAGNVSVERKSDLWGAQFNFRRGLCCGCDGYVDFLFGFSALGLSEALTVREDLLALRDVTRGAVFTPAGTQIRVEDHFSTSNRFYGGQIGLDTEYRMGRWSLDWRATVALGNTQQMARIDGMTTSFLFPNPPVTAQGGLLALPGTNIGSYFHNKFTVVPQTSLTLGYNITPWARFTLGYNFLYWSSVIRPGGLIDRGVNPTFQPGAVPSMVGAPRPAPQFNTTDLWAQGLSVGMEFRW